MGLRGLAQAVVEGLQCIPLPSFVFATSFLLQPQAVAQALAVFRQPSMQIGPALGRFLSFVAQHLWSYDIVVGPAVTSSLDEGHPSEPSKEGIGLFPTHQHG